MKKNTKYFVADFETTVDDDTQNQKKTEVWSSAWIELFDSDENVHVDNCIADTYYKWVTLDSDIIVYYHNAKFDGEFWINYLFSKGFTFKHCKRISKRKIEQLKVGEFDCLVSEMGMFYWLRVKMENGKKLEIRDSLKLVPMTLREAGRGFKTKYQKLDMNYRGDHYAGCKITDIEMKYIKNDVLVLKEIMELFINEGHDKLTIGGCCMSEFKTYYDKLDFAIFFPNLKLMRLNSKFFQEKDADEYTRRALKGGWTYLKEEYADKILSNGFTFDVNSLYTSVQHSKSGNYYPVGSPHFFLGKPPAESYFGHRVFIVKIQCDFEIKDGFLPTVQLKGDYHYDANEYLKTSKIRQKDGSYSHFIYENGEKIHYSPILYMTNVDLELFFKHYHVYNLKYLSGCWFRTEIGLFDQYIDKYFAIKQKEKGAKRQESKLFLNNLWGKFSSSDDSSFKEPYLIDRVLNWRLHKEHDKKPLYVPVGVFVTAYARQFTITAAQQNYDKFVYSDTDSVHMIDNGTEVNGITEHDSALLCWKKESTWSRARFLHSKTYIEQQNLEESVIQKAIEDSIKDNKTKSRNEIIYILKCCGMPDSCKSTFLKSVEDPILEFKDGLNIDGKLIPKRIEGGQVLIETYFTIKENNRFFFRH